MLLPEDIDPATVPMLEFTYKDFLECKKNNTLRCVDEGVPGYTESCKKIEDQVNAFYGSSDLDCTNCRNELEALRLDIGGSLYDVKFPVSCSKCYGKVQVETSNPYVLEFYTTTLRQCALTGNVDSRYDFYNTTLEQFAACNLTACNCTSAECMSARELQ